MNDKLQVGLIGLGAISFAHEAGFAELGEVCKIAAMCDIQEDEVNSRIGMYAGCQGYTRYRDLLNDPAIDLVDITVPHALHYEIA
jgi:UDP-N-acetyl-2-amino-2-deoxyglucuronate dehydrogenase